MADKKPTARKSQILAVLFEELPHLKENPEHEEGAERVALRLARAATRIEQTPYRRRLPDTRKAVNHKFELAGRHKGYIRVGLYEDGQPGEIFLTMAKQGSTVSGLVNAFATAISMALQYGVPLRALVDKFKDTRFEPSGPTGNPEIKSAKSITDYIFRWLALKFSCEEVPGEKKVPADLSR